MAYLRYIIIALGVVAALFLLRLFVQKFAQIKKFFMEVWSELKKVSWPTQRELISSTWIVIITTLILSVFLGAMDLGFSTFLSTLIK